MNQDMCLATRIDSVRFTAAPVHDHAKGLLGWVTFVVDQLVTIDGVAVRRTLDGRITLSYPARRNAAGREYPYVRPVNDHARRELEQQLLTALGIEDRQ